MVRGLDEAALARALEGAVGAGFESAAIAFLHSDLNPDHERRAEAIARAAGLAFVAVSSEVSPLPRFIPRAETAVADAYLTPGLRAHVEEMERAVAGADLYFMTSGGGLVRAAAFRGRDAVLSGPAGGVVGVARTAAAAGAGAVLGFDMGGTSTDVCRFAGALERRDTATVAGVKLRAPMLDVETVAAGGGSILAFDGLRARVGPASAGADPGPAAYGQGGPATVTDANLVLGRVDPSFFPAVFGAAGDAPLDLAAARARWPTSPCPWISPTPRPPPKASSPLRWSRPPPPSGAHRPSGVSIRATMPWSPSAGRPDRWPVRSPTPWRSTTSSVRGAPACCQPGGSARRECALPARLGLNGCSTPPA